ncbi:hypothetical protein MPER_13599 [Moniliophthora perniciosa FA553]|nr:hypothetical protein MPER_13599 [Moniliophthora perniciosa FA553]
MTGIADDRTTDSEEGQDELIAGVEDPDDFVEVRPEDETDEDDTVSTCQRPCPRHTEPSFPDSIFINVNTICVEGTGWHAKAKSTLPNSSAQYQAQTVCELFRWEAGRTYSRVGKELGI